MSNWERFNELKNNFNTAISNRNAKAAQDVLDEIETLFNQVDDPDLSDEINTFLANGSVRILDGTLPDRADKVDGFGGLAEAFTKAAKAAEKAEKDLFFNKLSTTLTGIEKTIKTFKARAKEIEEALKAIDKPKDLEDAKKALGQFKTVVKALDGLKSDLEGIDDKFKNPTG